MDHDLLAQELNSNKKKCGEIRIEELKEMTELSGSEGIVLLKNEGVLPFTREKVVSYFGRCTYDYFCVGYGSGGDVITPYKHSLYDGLCSINVNINEELNEAYQKWRKENSVDRTYEWGEWPMYYPEYDISDDEVIEASLISDIGVVTIGRSAGEDRDSTLTKGSFYLTDLELKLMKKVNKYFKKTVIIVDSGNLIDFSFVNEIRCDGLIVAYHGGMSSGDSLAKILYGIYTPSGHLTSTIAKDYYDYPSSNDFGGKYFNNYTEDVYVGYRYFHTFAKDKILFPFGFGLSYTKFEYSLVSFELQEMKIHVRVNVVNAGNYSGKEVIQVYLQKPAYDIERELVGFKKSVLLKPGESDILDIEIDLAMHSSYDEMKCEYYLYSGKYTVFIGENALDCNVSHSFELKDGYTKHVSSILQARDTFKVLTRDGYRDVVMNENTLKADVINDIPESLEMHYDSHKTLDQVRNGDITLDEFISSLSIKEMDDLTHGEGDMNSIYGVSGNAGAFGGITDELRSRGIPAVITCDGPSGVRCNNAASLIPCATNLASSFNVELVERLYSLVSRELKEFNVDVLLAPGMNIIRNPLCGRNFEYYSEDPYLSGVIAAAAVRGIQSLGACACPKHFALNNQEYNRYYNDSRVSEKALREIYLRNFEVMLKYSKPKVIMTSYNKLNSIYTYYNYHLVKSYLKDEMGFDGVVITDWWMKPQRSTEFNEIVDDAYRIRACVDVAMPGFIGTSWDGTEFIEGRNIARSLEYKDGLKIAELQRVCRYILRFILQNK